MDIIYETINDEDLSSDEETLLSEIKALEAFDKEPESSSVESQAINNPLDAIRVISSGFDDLPATPDNLLDLNRLMICSLKQMEAQVEAKLNENIYEQQKLISKISSVMRDFKPLKYPSYQKCGMPYFSTANGWSQAKNRDTLKHQALGYLSPMQHFQPINIWSYADNERLRTLVKQFDKEAKIEALEVKMEKIKNKNANLADLSALKNECLAFQMDENQKLDEQNIDWLRIAASMKSDFTPIECEYQWFSILSPSVNQEPWSKEEKMELKRIAKAHNYQSWEKIAAELGTNRSPLACCHKFQSTAKNLAGRWTTEEDVKLKENIQLIGQTCRSVSLAAMLCMNRPYEEVSLHVKQLEKKINSSKYRSKLKILSIDKSDTKLQVKYRNMCQRFMTYDKDVALLKGVIDHGEDWEKVSSSVSGLYKDYAEIRFKQLTSLGEEAIHVMKSKKMAPKETDTIKTKALKLLGILEFLTEKFVTIYGVSFNRNAAMANFIEILAVIQNNLFGPRYRPNDEKLRNLTVFSNLLRANFNHMDITKRWESYSQITCAYSNDKFDTTEVMKSFQDQPVTNYSALFGGYLMPPNLLTLIGARTLIHSRTLLHKQSTLPLTKTNGTVMNPFIAKEDRLSFTCAKDLLRERLRTLFFMSLVLSKVSVTNDSSFMATQRYRKQLPKPLTRKKRKRLMSSVSKQRWKLKKPNNDEEMEDELS